MFRNGYLKNGFILFQFYGIECRLSYQVSEDWFIIRINADLPEQFTKDLQAYREGFTGQKVTFKRRAV